MIEISVQLAKQLGDAFMPLNGVKINNGFINALLKSKVIINAGFVGKAEYPYVIWVETKMNSVTVRTEIPLFGQGDGAWKDFFNAPKTIEKLNEKTRANDGMSDEVITKGKDGRKIRQWWTKEKIERDAYQCEDCGKYYDKRFFTKSFLHESEVFICDDCMENYGNCPMCERLVNNDEIGESGMCEDCEELMSEQTALFF